MEQVRNMSGQISHPFFLTDCMPDLTHQQVHTYRDSQNDRQPGGSDDMCVITVAPVTFEKTGETMEIRSALGLYNKQGCGDVAEKLALVTKLIAIVNDYLESHPIRSTHVREGKVATHVMS